MATAMRKTVRRFEAGFGKMPGRTRAGSTAGSARQEMDGIIQRYEALLRHLQGVTPTVLHNALLPVFNRSQVYVPKKTGKLMDSGNLYVGTNRAGQTEGSITYGGKDVPYAPIVHEATWLNHVPPTRAKFLQDAMEEQLDAVMSSLIVDYSIAMGMGR
jgi:hypothetical protein